VLYQPGESPSSPFGYNGQIVIREQLLITDTLRQVLAQPNNRYSVQEMELAAREDGMLTMFEAAVLAAIRGETTIEEVNRVL
jgi:type IV pilus assembly protein PilB